MLVYTLFIAVVVLVAAAWIYHRWSSQTQKVVDTAAAVVNKTIDEGKAVANTK